MNVSTAVFNGVMVVVEVLAFWLVLQCIRSPSQPPVRQRVMIALALLGGMMILAGWGLREDPFGAMRLWCWGLFVHLPAFLIAAGVLLLRKSRRWGIAGLLASLPIIVVGVDAFFIEPTWLEVTHVRLSSDKLTKPLTIVVIADFQTDRIGDYERRVLAEAKAANPDLILWAGDYLQEHRPGRWEVLREEMRGALAEADLQPPLGSYAVGGNVDDSRWPEIFAGSQVVCFPKTGSAEPGEIVVTGLAMRQSFKTDVKVAPRPKFQIVLGHCPNFALGKIDADLLVAGHIHGGQVRLPFYGPLMTKAVIPQSWTTGATMLDNRRTLVVSRGVGMERSYAPRLRFLCRPELMVVHVTPDKTVRVDLPPPPSSTVETP